MFALQACLLAPLEKRGPAPSWKDVFFFFLFKSSWSLLLYGVLVSLSCIYFSTEHKMNNLGATYFFNNTWNASISTCHWLTPVWCAPSDLWNHSGDKHHKGCLRSGGAIDLSQAGSLKSQSVFIPQQPLWDSFTSSPANSIRCRKDYGNNLTSRLDLFLICLLMCWVFFFLFKLMCWNCSNYCV